MNKFCAVCLGGTAALVLGLLMPGHAMAATRGWQDQLDSFGDVRGFDRGFDYWYYGDRGFGLGDRFGGGGGPDRFLDRLLHRLEQDLSRDERLDAILDKYAPGSLLDKILDERISLLETEISDLEKILSEAR